MESNINEKSLGMKNSNNSYFSDAATSPFHPSSPIKSSNISNGLFLMSKLDEEISKELKIKLLQEKLEFTQKQLEEKDKQLEHYKQLVKTLKDVLSEMSSKNIKNTPSFGTIGTPFRSNNRPPPPGFETFQNKNLSKGKKTRSFHNDIRNEEENSFSYEPRLGNYYLFKILFH